MSGLYVLGFVLGLLGVCAGFGGLLALLHATEAGGRKAWALFAVFAIATPGLFVGALESHNEAVTGRGSETGFITAVQQRGGIWPTPDLFFKTDTNNSETYQYCLTPGDGDLYAQALELARQRVFVRVHYEERATWYPWQCNQGPMVTSIEVIA